jgi:hypothetical protein
VRLWIHILAGTAAWRPGARGNRRNAAGLLYLQTAAPKSGSPLAGYVFTNQGTEHVIYIDVDNSVHELYRQGSSWYSGVVSASIPISH